MRKENFHRQITVTTDYLIDRLKRGNSFLVQDETGRVMRAVDISVIDDCVTILKVTSETSYLDYFTARTVN